jgi:uncharacterized membrane protein YagU involved in acid resistance
LDCRIRFAAVTTRRSRLLLAILCAGLIAGSVDIGAAVLINWLNPVIILHAIASGIVGKASFNDGIYTALLGLMLQWAMSLFIAAIFVVAAGKLPLLARRWVLGGISYGVVIFLVMNYVVVPLSAAPWNPWKRPFSPDKFLENLLAMILFGLIVAFCTHYFTANAETGGHNETLVSPA